MDEEGDAERAAQWDLAAADVAYKAQVEAALAQQRAAEEEQRLLIEQLEVCTSCSVFAAGLAYGDETACSMCKWLCNPASLCSAVYHKLEYLACAMCPYVTL